MSAAMNVAELIAKFDSGCEISWEEQQWMLEELSRLQKENERLKSVVRAIIQVRDRLVQGSAVWQHLSRALDGFN